MANGIGTAFHQIVEEGTYRLHRRWPALLATGVVGGIDVSLGVLATLLVMHRTGDELLASLAFSIGFVALSMARSELFTENFLVPVAAVVAGKARGRSLPRLWGGTAVANVAGGCLMIAIVLLAFPELGEPAVDKGLVYIQRGIGLEAFASSVIAGILITLMTWMQQGTDATSGRIVAAVITGFLLSYGNLSHVVVASLEVFAGILGGADFDVSDWFGMFLLWAAGNAVGGIGLVTMLRLVQVGPRRLRHEREQPIEETDEAMADVAREDAPAPHGADRPRGRSPSASVRESSEPSSPAG